MTTTATRNQRGATHWKPCDIRTILFLALLLAMDGTFGFVIPSATTIGSSAIGDSSATTSLFSNAPRQPRRMLKKRRKRNRNGNPNQKGDDFPWDTAESRSLVPSISKESGEDYWIDQDEFEREAQRLKNRPKVGEVSKEKLMTEVKAPYKQNWIGYFSMVIVILSAIVIKFPELLATPVIEIPDL